MNDLEILMLGAIRSDDVLGRVFWEYNVRGGCVGTAWCALRSEELKGFGVSGLKYNSSGVLVLTCGVGLRLCGVESVLAFRVEDVAWFNNFRTSLVVGVRAAGH